MATLNMRQNAEEEFSNGFKVCNYLTLLLGTGISPPKLTGRQTQTTNIPANNYEDIGELYFVPWTDSFDS